MATSGGIVSQTLKSSNFYVNWQQTSQSVENNKTYINWQVGINCNGNYWYSNAVRINYVNINGVEVFGDETYSNMLGGSYELANGTAEIPHNSDGTKSFSVEVSGWLYSYGDTYGSGSFTLNQIPRKSSMTVSSGTINSTKPKFTIARASDSFTHTINYFTPGTSTENTIATGVGTTYQNWTPPDTLYQYFPNSNHITLTYKLYTYSGGIQIGSDTFQGTIFSNQSECTPTLTVTATPTDYSSLTGSTTKIIKGMSNVTVSATATAKKSATISNIKTNGQTLTNGSKTFSAVETNVFTTVATDSRGYTKTDTKTLGEVIPYIKLSVSATANRVNATSSTVKATVTGQYYNGNFSSGGVANTLTLTWKYKLRSASSYSTGGTLTATYSSGTYTTGEVTLGTNFDYDKDYEFQFTAKDKLLTKSTVAPVNAGVPIYDYGVDSNGNNYLWVNGNLYANRSQSKIIGQDMITVYATRGSVTFTETWQNVSVSAFTLENSIGTKLTISNGKVKIGKGVSKVFAYAMNEGFYSNTLYGDKCFNIQKNGQSLGGGSYYSSPQGGILPLFTCMNIISVQENDLIGVTVMSGATGTLDVLGTYLFVQVIE